MATEHIDFESWEPGEPVDRGHLGSCTHCRLAYDAARVVRAHAAHAPRLEPSAFFAPRTARMAFEKNSVPLFFFLQRLAPRLMPVFGALVLAVSFLLFQQASATFQEAGYEETDWTRLLVQEPVSSEVTMDDVLQRLIEPADEMNK